MGEGDASEGERGGGDALFVGLGVCLAVGVLAMYSMKRRWQNAAQVAGRSAPSESYIGSRAPENGRLLHRRRRQDESDNSASRGVAVSSIAVNEVSTTSVAPNRVTPVSSVATDPAPDADALQGTAGIPVARRSPQSIPADLPVAVPPAGDPLLLRPATAELPVAIPSPRSSSRSSPPTGDSLLRRNTADLPVAIPLAKPSTPGC